MIGGPSLLDVASGATKPIEYGTRDVAGCSREVAVEPSGSKAQAAKA